MRRGCGDAEVRSTDRALGTRLISPGTQNRNRAAGKRLQSLASCQSPSIRVAGHGCSRTISSAWRCSKKAATSRRSSTRRPAINPLWQPPWPSIEPSAFERRARGALRLLARTHGCWRESWVTTCVSIFSAVPPTPKRPPGSPPTAKPPLPAIRSKARSRAAIVTATFPLAQIVVQRQVELKGRWLRVTESVENLAAIDRPIGWTQHVTHGPALPGTRSHRVPTSSDAIEGLRRRRSVRRTTSRPAPNSRGRSLPEGRRPARPSDPAPARLISSAYTAHLLDPAIEQASFVAFSPGANLAFGYVWRRADFPWAGYLGREQQPDADAVERSNAHEGRRVRRLALSRITP